MSKQTIPEPVKQFHAELAEIVKHLPGTWTEIERTKTYERGGEFRNENGAGLYLGISWREKEAGRLAVSVEWPKSEENYEYKPPKMPGDDHITLARNRGVETIAKEINRRILSWYLSAYAEQLELVQKANDRRHAMLKTAAELRALVPGHRERDDNKLDAWGLEGRVNHDQDVSLQLDYLTPTQARAVLLAAKKAGVTFKYNRG